MNAIFGRVWALVVVGVLLVAGGGVGSANAAGSSGDFSSRGIPLRGQVLFGSAVIGDVAPMEAEMGGRMGIRRSYFQGGQVTAAVNRARSDLEAGRLPWISFKTPVSWSSMGTGGGDAWARDVAAQLGALPGPVWVAIHHEPEGDGPVAEWKAMQQRMAPIFRAQPNVAYTMILMGWNQFYSGNSAESMDAFWPGKQYIDVLGFDPYNWYSTTGNSGSMTYRWAELKEYYAKIKSWLDSTGNGEVKWAIAETAYSDTAASVSKGEVAPNGKTVSTAGTGAQWLARAYDDMKSMGGIALTYFNVAPQVNRAPADRTWPIVTDPKVSVFRETLARSDRLTDTAPPSPPPSTVPVAPVGVVASATGESTVSVSWPAVSGATDYTLRRDGVVIGNVSQVSFSDTGLAAGTTYSYTVMASNAGGMSPASAAVSVTTQEAPAPEPVAVPVAPVGVVASATGESTVSVSWPEVSGATGYTVRRDGAWVKTTNSTSFEDASLAPGTTYSYVVRAYNVAGISPESASAEATTQLRVPVAPVGVVASATGESTVSVSWPAVSGATDYTLRRDGVVIGNVSQVSFSDTGLAAGTTYSYTVMASNAGGMSPASAAVSVTTQEAPAPEPVAVPVAPVGVVASATGESTVSVSWPEVSGATGYTVRRDGAWVKTTNSTSFEDAGLAPGTTYSYVVRAYNVAGISPESASAEATTQLRVPVAPVGVVASATGESTVSVSWPAVSGATDYTLRRDGVVIGNVSQVSFSDTGLAAGTTYSYTVMASNAGGMSPASAAVSVTTQEAPAPEPVAVPVAPVGVVASATGESTVSVSWPEVSGATGYTVRRDGAWVKTTNSTSFEDAGLAPGTTYSYVVRAHNVAGISPESASAEATTQLRVPVAPVGVVASATGRTTVSVTWPAVSGATDYTVRRDGAVVVSTQSTTFTDSGLARGSSHTYVVEASNAAGSSPASASVTVKTKGKPRVSAALDLVSAVKVSARREASVLRVNINPNLDRGSWKFKVQKLAKSGRWVTGETYRTKGPKETRTVDLGRGTYRVVVPAQYGYKRELSRGIALRT